VTGFGPFGTVQDNPSAKIAESLNQPHEVLEVSYRAVDTFLNRLDPESFDLWLMLGVAASRPKLSLELFGRNVRHGADVLGDAKDGSIDPSGPLLLFSTIWSPELVADVMFFGRQQVATSMDAGNYLCNYILYRGLSRFPNKHVGFLHVVVPERVEIQRQVEIARFALASAAERT